VIKNGKVVEQGSHSALIANNDGVYNSLIRRQLESQRKLDGVDASFVSSDGSQIEDSLIDESTYENGAADSSPAPTDDHKG
jgi:hypothetical protein